MSAPRSRRPFRAAVKRCRVVRCVSAGFAPRRTVLSPGWEFSLKRFLPFCRTGVLALFAYCAALNVNVAAAKAPTGGVGLDASDWVALQVAAEAATGRTIRRIGGPSGLAGDGEALDRFGYSVALAGNVAAVGAYLDDVGGFEDQGSVYVFSRDGSGWRLVEKLVADDGAPEDLFGGAIAIDGDSLLVGAPLARIEGDAQRGAAYVFARTPSGWEQRSKLIASDGASGDLFGSSVALRDGMAIVSAPMDDVGANSNQGSAYVFSRSGEDWQQHTKLTAGDGGPDDEFATAVAMDGDLVLLGAPGHRAGANVRQGAVYAFARSAGTWPQQGKLLAADGAAGDGLGRSIALDGNSALVGAWNFSTGGGQVEGSAYIFRLSGGIWTQQQKLTSGTPGNASGFGFAVALRGDRALVGAPYAEALQGLVFSFAQTGGIWTRSAVITDIEADFGEMFGSALALGSETLFIGIPSDSVGTNSGQGSVGIFALQGAGWTAQQRLTTGDGMAGANYGWSVDLDGDTAVVGAPTDDAGALQPRGAAHVFARTGLGWSLQARLIAADAPENSRFGDEVAVSGDTIAVSANQFTFSAGRFERFVYVFVRKGTIWQQQAKLAAPEVTAVTTFGSWLDIDGDTLIASASRDQVGTNDQQGAAYVFVRSGGSWSLQARLVAADGAAGDQLGSGVALSGDTALVGAWLDGVGANLRQGSAYVFSRTAGVWSQQARLVAQDGGSESFFGIAVALEGDTALVGAPFAQVGVNTYPGAAYVFTRSGSDWSQAAKLASADGATGDRFGLALDLAGGMALIGAPSTSVGSNSEQGAGYLFSLSQGAWIQDARIIAADGRAGNGFGWDVSVSGNAALVGTSGANGPPPYGNPREGAAYSVVNLGSLFGDGFEAALRNSQ